MKEQLKINKDGLDLIKSFEGLRLQSYLCSANVPTIGYGTTIYPNGIKVKLGESITLANADKCFEVDIQKFVIAVNNLVRVNLTQNQFNALVSFSYNVGIGNFNRSTLLKLVNANPDDDRIRSEFMKWDKAGGKVVKGLTNRRKIESDIYYKK